MKKIPGGGPIGNISILLYHQIGDVPNLNTNFDCFCSSEVFYYQMEFLKNSDYKVISLVDAIDLITYNKIIDSKYVVLTFDDGCERFYDVTFPIIEKFGFPTTIYPVVGYLGKYASWGTITNARIKILSKRMVVELNNAGVEIGAHTIDHPKLTRISRNSATDQVRCSKALLEELIGESVRSFAYPHGDFNQQIVEIVKEVGFMNALTCINKNAEEAKSVFEIPRKYVTYFDSLDRFILKLN